MSSTLIVNLKRFGDILSSLHLVARIKEQKPHEKIAFLVYEEFARVLENVKVVDQVYTIDRKKILLMKKNPIFSDAFGINEIFDSVKDVRETQWTTIVNYSNCKVGGCLTSYLKSEQTKIAGISFKQDSLVEYSDLFAMYLNEVLTNKHLNQWNIVDVFSHMLGVGTETPDIDIFDLRADYEQLIQENIQVIRSKFPNKILMTGIQLMTSHKHKMIPYDLMCDVIEELLSSTVFFPILVIAPDKKEREYAAKINGQFGNILTVIEADFRALPSVLRGLDCLITPDTITKHMADLIKVPLLEVALGPAPYSQLGTIGRKNLLLTTSLTCAPCSLSQGCNQNPKHQCGMLLSKEEIIQGLEFLVYGQSQYQDAEFNYSRLSYVSKDTLGVEYVPIQSADSDFVQRRAIRVLIERLIMKTKSVKAVQSSMNLDWNQVNEWADSERQVLTETSRSLLKTLRVIRTISRGKGDVNELVKALDELLVGCEHTSLATIPLLLLRGKLDNVSFSTPLESYQQIEQKLFELKGDIQVVMDVIAEVCDESNKAIQRSKLEATRRSIEENIHG